MRRMVVNGVDAEVAETFAERARGLIGRDGLAPGTGMLNELKTMFSAMKTAVNVIRRTVFFPLFAGSG